MLSSPAAVRSRRGGEPERLSSQGPVRHGETGFMAEMKNSLRENSESSSKRQRESSMLS